MIIASPVLPPQVDRVQIIDWSIDRIKNYVDMTMLEENNPSRTLNKFTLCMMVSMRYELSSLSPAVLLFWRHSSSPALSTTNVRRHVTVAGRYLALNGRRRGSK